MKRFLILITILAFSAQSAADSDAVAAAEDSSTSASVLYGSAADIKKNLATPLMSAEQMTTVGGDSFSAQLGCTSSEKFLELFAAPGATGDIQSLQVSQDLNLDGTTDRVFSPPLPISGVCANGVIACTAGSWESCQSLKWSANEDGHLGLTATSMGSLGGCYCVNNSCGENLVMGNLNKVLSDLGGGATGALSQVDAYTAASEVSITGPVISFHGQRAGDCSEGPTHLTEYRDTPNSLASDAFSASDTNQLYEQITTSPSATQDPSTVYSCSITRTVGLDETTLNDIIDYDNGDGNVLPCGPNCLRLTLGVVGDDYWHGGRCTYFEHNVSFRVLQPERILDARLKTAVYDDWVQVWANSSLIWNGPYGTWTGNGGVPGSCEQGRSRVSHPEIDFTSHLGNVGPVDFKVRVAVGGGGEGYALADIQVDTACHLKPDHISNTCQAYQENDSCNLIEETVDGVQTFANFAPTGLSALPSTNQIIGASCTMPVTRDWWSKQRKYRCSTSNTYDFDTALARSKHVQASTTSSSYEDYLRQPDGSVNTPQGTISLLEEVEVEACTSICKTRKPRLATDATKSGVVSEHRVDPETYDFFYRECDAGMCPLEDGETLIQGCGCLNEFPQATATFQAIRQAGRDVICSSGTEVSLD